MKSRWSLFVSLVLVMGMAGGAAADDDAIRLWPADPPGPAVSLGEEKDLTGPKDGLVAGRPVIRIGNVSTPTLTIFRPKAGRGADTAVIIAPGGGHRIVAWDLEGTEVADWLTSLGVTAFVLKYRVPARNPEKPWESAVQDAHRAVRIVRSRAGEFGVSPKRVGLIGFSAGGQTTAMACVLHAQETYPPVDEVDSVSARPDFAALVYPGGLLAPDSSRLADHVVVNETLPPMFFAQPFPDFGRVENSLLFAAALKKAGVPAEVHVHATGGHGYGLRPTDEPCTHWPDACETWMRRMGWLPKDDEPRRRPISEVLALPADELADGVTIRIRGVVTARGAATCVQDEAAGIWCRPAKTPPTSALPSADGHVPAAEARLSAGTAVEIIGVVRRGLYAPTVESTSVKVLGTEELPPPIPVDVGRLFRGGDNALRVEVGGAARAIVQGCRDSGGSWTLVLDVASRRIAVAVDKTLIRDRPDHLIDTEVRVVGVVGAVRNSRGEFIAPMLSIADAGDLVVVKPAPSSPFESPRVPLGGLATYRPEPFDGHRVWTEGVVTCVVPKQCCYLQDGPTGIRIDCPEAPELAVGDRVRVAGFIDTHRGTAGMVEGIVERLGGGAPPAPAEVSPAGICELIGKAYQSRVLPSPGDYANTLVYFPATLVERQRTSDGWTLTLTDQRSTIVARLPTTREEDHEAVARLALGSDLAVTGVAQIGREAATEPLTGLRLPEPTDIEILLRSADDLALVRAPSWWTARRLGLTAAALAAVLAAAAVWVLLLRRQVVIQARRIAAEQQSRHDAAVEFQATLRERNRLAANLHDTVLQTVTGIGYQLTACTGDDGEIAPDVSRHFGLVERMVKHAVLQLRGTVWALRATSPVNRTLPEAIEDLAARLGDEHDMAVKVELEPGLPPVPDFVAGNLLLIAQEAILNALRHARGTAVRVSLCTVPSAGMLELTVADDGCGFESGSQPGARQGHFGLDGIRERAERIGGRLAIESLPGQGTTVTVTLPLAAIAPDRDAAAPSDRTLTAAAAGE